MPLDPCRLFPVPPDVVRLRVRYECERIRLKKLKHTPNSRINSCIRQLWLRSRERAAALKRDNYTCQECGVKQSTAKGKKQKVEVHHLEGIPWDLIHRILRKYVLVNPDKLETLCPECHKIETAKQREET